LFQANRNTSGFNGCGWLAVRRLRVCQQAAVDDTGNLPLEAAQRCRTIVATVDAALIVGSSWGAEPDLSDCDLVQRIMSSCKLVIRMGCEYVDL
jgi:hypothetical protein